MAPTTSTSAMALHLAAFAGQLDPDVVREYAGVAHGVDATLADMARIQQSPDLTTQGRAKQLEARRAEANTALLNPLRAKLQRTQQRFADVERAAVPPRPPTQDNATLHREREIRDRLTGKD